jgi:hypothetical protein
MLDAPLSTIPGFVSTHICRHQGCRGSVSICDDLQQARLAYALHDRSTVLGETDD